MPKLEAYHGTYLWDYVPNLPAAILFATLFTLATFIHIWKICKGKMWFCIPFVIGGVCMFLAFTESLSRRLLTKGHR